MPERPFCAKHDLYLDRYGICSLCTAEDAEEEHELNMFGPHEGYEPDGLDEERWEGRR